MTGKGHGPHANRQLWFYHMLSLSDSYMSIARLPSDTRQKMFTG